MTIFTSQGAYLPAPGPASACRRRRRWHRRATAYSEHRGSGSPLLGHGKLGRWSYYAMADVNFTKLTQLALYYRRGSNYRNPRRCDLARGHSTYFRSRSDDVVFRRCNPPTAGLVYIGCGWHGKDFKIREIALRTSCSYGRSWSRLVPSDDVWNSYFLLELQIGHSHDCLCAIICFRRNRNDGLFRELGFALLPLPSRRSASINGGEIFGRRIVKHLGSIERVFGDEFRFHQPHVGKHPQRGQPNSMPQRGLKKAGPWQARCHKHVRPELRT